MLYSRNKDLNHDGYTTHRCDIVYPKPDGYTSYIDLFASQYIAEPIRQVEKFPTPNGIFGFIKQLWRLWKQARCKHTHFIKIDLDGFKRYSDENDIVLYFCYICGYVCVERKDHDSIS